MSDLSFVAGEFPRLASSAREAAEAVRSARPEGGASAFASAMPGTNLSSKMQGVEDKFADQATKTGTSLDEHAESLLAAERDFIAAEEENTKLIGSIIEGHSYGAGAAGHSKGAGLTGHSIGGKGDSNTIGGEPLTGHSYGAGATGHSKGAGLTGHSYGASQRGEWWREQPIGVGPMRPSDIPGPVKDAADSVVRGAQEVASDLARGAQEVAEGVARGAKEVFEGLREEAENFDPTTVAGPMMGPPSWLDDVKRQ